MVGSQWSGKVGCFLVFFMIPSGAGNLHSNPDFQIHTIQRWSHLKTWNQSLVILDIPNFNPMKEALWYSHPLLRYSIFRDGLRLYFQKKEWYVHIVRGPCPYPLWPCCVLQRFILKKKVVKKPLSVLFLVTTSSLSVPYIVKLMCYFLFLTPKQVESSIKAMNPCNQGGW